MVDIKFTPLKTEEKTDPGRPIDFTPVEVDEQGKPLNSVHYANDLSELLSLPPGMTNQEADKTIKYNIYGRGKYVYPTLRTGVYDKGFEEDPVAVKELGKGLARGVLGVEKGFNRIIQWFGDTAREIHNIPYRAVGNTLWTLFPEKMAERQKNVKPAIGVPVAEEKFVTARVAASIQQVGKENAEWWDDRIRTGVLKPNQKLMQGSFLENPSFLRAGVIITEAVPSVGAAFTASVATGNPWVGAGFLGALESSEMQAEAREAGLGTFEATFKVGLPVFIATTALEKAPFDFFLGGGTKITKKAFETIGKEGSKAARGFLRRKFALDAIYGFASESAQEVSQQFVQNMVAKFEYDPTRNLFEGMIESLIAGGATGFALGGFTSGRGGAALDNMVNDAKSKGVTDEELNALWYAAAQTINFNSELINKGLMDRALTVSDLTKKIMAKPPAFKLVTELEMETMIAEAKKQGLTITEAELAEAIKEVPEVTPEAVIKAVEDAKAIPEELKLVAEEAKKFETAEEFVKKISETTLENREIKNIPIDRIDFETDLAKRDFGKAQKELKEGTARPLSKEPVRAVLNISTGKYEIVDGFHRIANAINKGKSEVKAGIEFKSNVGKIERDKQLTDIWEKAQAKPAVVKPGVEKAPITVLRETIEQARAEFKTEPAKTKAEIKAVQSGIIKQLEASDLAAKDKAKFIRAIKNIQTQEQIIKTFPEIENRIARLEVAAKKRDFSVKIKKELKTTKPLKVGQRRVGKFDFESNKTFDTLRDYNKLTQEKAQAEFDKLPEEVTNEVDLIKKRFLSLKANGASASVEIYEQIHKDILRIKSLGKQAKDQADLEKKLNRQEKVESALSSIDKIKADKETIITQIGNAYRRGFSNIYSMFNSIAGKEFAETYNPELSENRRNAATYKKTLDITQGASDIYGEENIMRMFETMSYLDYEITDIKDSLTTKLSKLEIIDIYNSIKNDKKKNDYYEAFGKDQVENLIGKLTSNDTLFGDFLQEAVQGYREILNKRNIEIIGLDLGFIENYWPATSEFQVSVLDDMKIQGETPSALKERAKARVIPIPRNAWYKAQKHIAQAEHVDKVSRDFEVLKRIFNDRKVKHAINKKFGEDVYNTITTQIDNLSLNKQTERIDAISGMFQKAINNWVTAKIALNPSTFVRQLMSMGNFAENMDVTEWAEGFFKGITSPKKTFNFVWNNAPFLKARFNKGYSEALKEAIKGAESISVNKGNWTKFLTSLVRAGDISAIVYGGFPLIQSELAKGKSMKEAIDTFEKATLKAQQSGLSSSVSQFQNSKNPFARLFLAFKNTSNQYFRKMADAVISYQNGDISLQQFSKTMAIYAVIQPILYVSAGFATKEGFSLLGRAIGLKKEDEDFEDLLEKFLHQVMVQLIVGPVNAMPVIDDVVKTAARKLTGQNIYKVFSTPLFDDLEKGVRSLAKKEVTGEDYLKATVSVLEPTTALPAATAVRYYEILTGKKIGKKEKKPEF